MSDRKIIYLDDAIDAVNEREWLTQDAKEILEEVIEQLPSAQPEPQWIPCADRDITVVLLKLLFPAR